jgi:thiopeptide-type bacteriocin biosynthesis protein
VVAVRATAAGVLGDFCAPGRGLGAWYESVYEPEAPLFGGLLAMAAAHRLFDTETQAWDRLQRLRRARRLPYADGVLALAQANELFASALQGQAEEVWDTWCQLAFFHGLQAPREAGAPVRPTLTGLAGRTPEGGLRAVLQELAHAQAEAGRALADLHGHGQLGQGLRAVLANVALFGWNRIGLAPAERQQVLFQALAAWHPYPARPLQAA